MVFDRKRRSSRWPVSRRTNFRTMIVARKICNNSCATITSSLMEWKERKRENVWKSARYSGQLEFPCDNRWCIKNHRRNESSYRVFANVYQHYRKDRGKTLFTDAFKIEYSSRNNREGNDSFDKSDRGTVSTIPL